MPSFPILILGASGSGKSTSIQTLLPNETFIFNTCKKELPFKRGMIDYTEVNKNTNPNGNRYTTDDYRCIIEGMKVISSEKPNVKNIIIEDSQYIILNEFMRKHSGKKSGNETFSLYNDIADHFWSILWEVKDLREDLFVFFLHHSEINEYGIIQPKSIGKLLNEKIDISGMFTIVLFAKREGDKNYFLTQNDGQNPAKTPIGMFDSLKINNDLQFVRESIINYYKGV